MEPLEDRELDGMLREWKAPPAPAGLRAAVFTGRAVPWWRRSIRLPLPAAACLLILLLAGLWRWVVPREPVVNNVVYTHQAAEVLTFKDLRPVSELQPRIIRRKDARN
jgi:hypothetical protein